MIAHDRSQGYNQGQIVLSLFEELGRAEQLADLRKSRDSSKWNSWLEIRFCCKNAQLYSVTKYISN
jgi:hypothetical protein